MPENPVVVFDASVLIPLILPASLSTRLFYRLDAAGWQVALSPQLLEEVHDKLMAKPTLRRWLSLPDKDIARFIIEDLPAKTIGVPGLRNAHGAVPDDPDDDKVIAAALEAGASYIVTEDRHLLDLGQYDGIKILSREAFNAELDRLGVP